MQCFYEKNKDTALLVDSEYTNHIAIYFFLPEINYLPYKKM